MARSEARLLFSVWEGLAEISDAAKLAYFAVLTDSSLTQCGAGPLRPSKWCKNLRWKRDRIEPVLSELDEHRKIFVDHDTEEVLIRTFVRRDGVAKMPNVLRAALKSAVLIESHRLRKELAVELRTLHDERAPEAEGLLREVLDECLFVADELEGVVRPREAAESAPAAEPEPGEKAPPSRCPKHEANPTNRPCRACGSAKDANREWHVARARAKDDVNASAARVRAGEKRKAIAACGICDERGYVGTAVCDHKPRALIKRRNTA
ncbi:hypothetical protein [Amycolatopsis sp. cmx-4-83]|uniref:hypothetical protein n=1 Tax=Amycolatopsis sp. cmx-4-83 TaxID=2790940 RepID=UPI00397E250C